MKGKETILFFLLQEFGLNLEGKYEYLEIADTVDNAVQEAEPGMLFHNFDSDPLEFH